MEVERLMSEREAKGKIGVKELSPIDVYKLLPRTNCRNAAKKTAWLSPQKS